ncbi:Caspase domain containing protein, partial [Lactarius tabidus]
MSQKKKGEFTFSCPMKEGAILCLPIRAKGADTVASADFGKWMIKHIDRWFAWARHLGLGVNLMEDIILLTGTHRTRSWTNVAFPGGQEDAQASFGANVDHSGDAVTLNWQFSHERNRGVVLNCGPDGEDLPEDQCIFIRGFRATRKLKIFPPRLKAAAGPNPDPDGYGEEPEAELIPIPALAEFSKYRDPLHILLEYITEEAPSSCDIVLVHDEDLELLSHSHNTPLDAPQSDVVLTHIRSLKPTSTTIELKYSPWRCPKDLSSAFDLNSTSADTESAWVATLSNIFEPSPASTSSAPQSFHVKTPLPREERSRWPERPGAFPEPNVPGHGVSMYPNAFAPSQQHQTRVGLLRRRPAPPIPPRNIPVQPTFPSDYASIPRAFVVPYQQGTGYINTQVNTHSHPAFPEAFPLAHPHARAPHTAQTPPYGANGFANPGRPGVQEPPPYSPAPVPSQSLTPRGPQPYGKSSSGRSYALALPPVFERAPPPQIPNPHAGPSFTSARPRQPDDVGHHQAPQPHAPASQLCPPHVRPKKALLVGIDYTRHRDRESRLQYGVYDAKEMARFLQEHLHFHPDNIRILTDDQVNQRKNLPTAANILAGMRWMVEGAQPGDSLFFYFSGKAMQIKDEDEEELDGKDECLCAMDYDDRRNPPAGIIVDDTMHDIMVKPLPRGCRLTAVLDCCNSGTLLDLPYTYDSQGVLKQNRPDIVQRKKIEADVIALSAFKDGGKTYEVRGGGALREAFILYMKRFGNDGTHLQVIQILRAHMAANGLSQCPQLSSSHWTDTDQRFSIT